MQRRRSSQGQRQKDGGGLGAGIGFKIQSEEEAMNIKRLPSILNKGGAGPPSGGGTQGNKQATFNDIKGAL